MEQDPWKSGAVEVSREERAQHRREIHPGLVGKLGAHQDRRQHRGRDETECQPAKPIHLEINPNAGHRRRASLVAATTARSPTPSQARLALALNCRLMLLARSSNLPCAPRSWSLSTGPKRLFGRFG